ncbi:transcription repressor OFP8-like [Telopea speciosissima]|uniref:transcription repressor OFP8-like n=1 Tax=Telopea speciosissima TaxID=54955 RepID=UPI001CC3484A|nr:transcription repressor OFP8-like [Telopea speciosissima]
MSSSSIPNTKKNIIGNTVAVKLGCGCRRPKLADVFRPRPKSKISSDHHHRILDVHHGSASSTSSSTSSCERAGGFSNNGDDETTTTTSFSAQYLDTTPPTHSEAEREETHCNVTKATSTTNCSSEDSKTVKGFGRISESVAVVKDSDDPYLDFRQSMLQMILEKEIYSKEDLRDLLDCFLQLNSPYHHEIIVRAFSEIWNGVFSVSTPGSSSSTQTLPL